MIKIKLVYMFGLPEIRVAYSKSFNKTICFNITDIANILHITDDEICSFISKRFNIGYYRDIESKSIVFGKMIQRIQIERAISIFISQQVLCNSCRNNDFTKKRKLQNL